MSFCIYTADEGMLYDGSDETDKWEAVYTKAKAEGKIIYQQPGETVISRDQFWDDSRVSIIGQGRGNFEQGTAATTMTFVNGARCHIGRTPNGTLTPVYGAEFSGFEIRSGESMTGPLLQVAAERSEMNLTVRGGDVACLVEHAILTSIKGTFRQATDAAFLCQPQMDGPQVTNNIFDVDVRDSGIGVKNAHRPSRRVAENRFERLISQVNAIGWHEDALMTKVDMFHAESNSEFDGVEYGPNAHAPDITFGGYNFLERGPIPAGREVKGRNFHLVNAKPMRATPGAQEISADQDIRLTYGEQLEIYHNGLLMARFSGTALVTEGLSTVNLLGQTELSRALGLGMESRSNPANPPPGRSIIWQNERAIWVRVTDSTGFTITRRLV